MALPPRYTVEGYKELNSLGTVPFFIDNIDGVDVHMTESVAICHYLGEKYQNKNTDDSLVISVTEPDYGNYLNWLYHSDATLTFPQTLVF